MKLSVASLIVQALVFSSASFASAQSESSAETAVAAKHRHQQIMGYENEHEHEYEYEEEIRGSLRSSRNRRKLNYASPAQLGPRIVGGQTASPGEFPWFVDWEGCGAALIHPQVILSAAHCDEAILNFFGGNVVYVGAYRSDSTQNGAVRRNLTRRISHPDYDSSTLAYDVAVAKLDDPVEGVPILPLNRNGAIPVNGQDLVVMGHGVTDNGSTANTLQKVTVDYVPTSQCNSPNSYDGEILGNIMMCAGVPAGGRDSCQGDSGGPIVACDPNDPSDCTQVGIVSWGYGCGEENFPGVYARVSGFIGWIDQMVCDLTEGQSNQPGYCDGSSPVTSSPVQSPVAAPKPTPPTPPGPGEVGVKFVLRFDNWPTENTWSLYENDTILYDGGPYEEKNAVLTFNWNLRRGVTYRLEVYDSYGDGLCCQYGSGGFEVSVVNTDGTEDVLFGSDGDFTEVESLQFSFEDNDVAPSSPVSPATDSPSPRPTPATPTPTRATPAPTPTTSAPSSAPSVPTISVPSPTGSSNECVDSDELFFVDMTNQNQTCSFLQEQPRFDYLCKFVDVAVKCKSTCNVCELFDSA